MAMPQVVRHINERRVLEALLRRGAMTRAEIGRELGLTRSTAGNLVTGLTQAGFLKDGFATDKEMGELRAGRPGSLVELNGPHAIFLGAEIGVGRIRIVGIDLRGEVVCRSESGFDPARSSPIEVVSKLAMEIRKLGGWSDPAKVRGLGIAVAGLISADGDVIRAPFLNWSNVPLTAIVNERVEGFSRVLVENDANVFAMAEMANANGQAPADAVYVLLDVGVGGGIVSGNVLVRGRHGSAGEIGHLPLVPRDDGGAGFKLPGSFESVVGIKALLADYRQLGGCSGDLPGFRHALGKGEPAAKEALERWAHQLGRGLAILTAVLDPDRFVLGGPAAVLLDACRMPVEEALRSHLLASQKLPAIALSKLGQDAPAIGSARLLQKQYLSLEWY